MSEPSVGSSSAPSPSQVTRFGLDVDRELVAQLERQSEAVEARPEVGGRRGDANGEASRAPLVSQLELGGDRDRVGRHGRRVAGAWIAHS